MHDNLCNVLQRVCFNEFLLVIEFAIQIPDVSGAFLLFFFFLSSNS